MWSTAHKHNQLSGAPPEVVELYRNNDFVSESLDSVCASSVIITADGQITTKTVGHVGDRHLQAQLNLPGLQERCAVSANKDLFKLSTLLGENEMECRAHEKIQKHMENKMGLPQHVYPWDIRTQAHTNDSKFTQQANNFTKQLDGIPTIKLHKPQQPDHREEGMPLPSVQKINPRKIKKTKHQKKKNDCSTDESCYDTADTSRKSVQYKRRRVEKPLSYKPYLEHAAEPQRDVLPQINASILLVSPFQRYKCTKFSKIVDRAKRTVQFFDDWNTYTILLLLCTLAYLGYMLGYDITEYASEERRYLAKMQSAGFVVKCFYYIMRLLKVPIF
ncbi:uncharacterized protein [Drosophila virilis]|uniref:Uncharacterized protein, isoform B n=1 Tax=Drosophila virilis TaxID=7244 RepID=A0A0Q9WI49_DROVI|nr:uncharacterized protein LOC6627035 isoform X3 [Drosophila virilis]KRF80325.1 uncharacterized protein Dvir_GJ20056, isoform B [Drosophila virilis]